MWIPKGAALIRGRHLFEARRLLEEIRYFDQNRFKLEPRNSKESNSEHSIFDLSSQHIWAAAVADLRINRY